MITPRLAAILEHGRRRVLPKGQVINMFDDTTFYLLKSGYVKRYQITKEGEDAIQAIYGPEQFFPLTQVIKRLLNENISDPNKSYYYRTMADTEILSIDNTVLDDAVASDPLLYKELFVEAGRRLKSNIHYLDNQALKIVRWRLAHELVYLAEEYGEETTGGVRVLIPLTQRDLANMLNASRETVSRTLSRLQNQGYIHVDKHITIMSIERLRAIYT